MSTFAQEWFARRRGSGAVVDARARGSETGSDGDDALSALAPRRRSRYHQSVLSSLALGVLMSVVAYGMPIATAESTGGEPTQNVSAITSTGVGFLDSKGELATSEPITASGFSQLPLLLVNTGAADSLPSPATLKLTLPEGVTLSAVESFDGASGTKTAAQWTCSPSDAENNCRLLDSSGESPTIAPKGYLLALVTVYARGLRAGQEGLEIAASGALGGASEGSTSVQLTVSDASVTKVPGTGSSGSGSPTSTVVPGGPQGPLAMQLFVESGRTTFERDTTEVFQIAHDVGYGSPTGLTDTVLIPTGMVAEPVNSAGWSCPGGTGEITCTHPGAIPAGVSVLSVRVYIEPTAEAGMTIVAAVAQSGDKQLQNQAIQLYTVSAGPHPTLQVKRATSSMLPLAVTTDELAEDTYLISNTGPADVPAGAQITVDVVLTESAKAFVAALPKDSTGLRLSLRGTGAASSCSSPLGAKATCTVTLSAPLTPASAPLAVVLGFETGADLSREALAAVGPMFASTLSDGYLAELTVSIADTVLAATSATAMIRVGYTAPDPVSSAAFREAASVSAQSMTTSSDASGLDAPVTAAEACVPGSVPDAPTIVSAPSNVDSRITVTWAAPTADCANNTSITGYTATAYSGSATPNTVTCTSLRVSCTLMGLTNGVSYAVTVKARNARGFGQASNPMAAIPAAVPDAPTGVVGTSLSDGESRVRWDGPSQSYMMPGWRDGGSPVTQYTVTSSPGRKTCTTNYMLTSCVVTGLTNGVTYTFTVTATNAAGTGAASQASAPVTPANRPGAP
jgi:hypothetical protein